MNYKSLISIVTVCLNSVQTIERAIISVINQNYSDVEIIIIDGGSTDGTVDIIKKYDQFISRWISEPDKGVYYAMNKGLKKATGEYVCFLNSDDWFEPNVLKNVADFIMTTGADVIYGDYNEVTGDGLKTRIGAKPISYINVDIPFCHQSAFVKKNRISCFDESYKIAADYKLFSEMYNAGYTFRYIPLPIVNFRRGGLADKNENITREEIYSIALKNLTASHKKAITYGPILLNYIVSYEYNQRIKNGYINNHVESFVSSKIPMQQDIIIFGTGEIYRKYRSIISSFGCRVKYCVDNNVKKVNTIDGKDVFLPIKLKEEENLAVIVLTENYCFELREQICRMGISESIDIYDYCSLKKEFREENDPLIIDYLCSTNSDIKLLVNILNE